MSSDIFKREINIPYVAPASFDPPINEFIGFNSPDLMTTYNTQALVGGHFNDFSSAIQAGSAAENVAADPGFFGSAAGQQLLLKGGLMILGMVTEAMNKPEQSTKPLDKKKVKEIRKKKKKKYGLA